VSWTTTRRTVGSPPPNKLERKARKGRKIIASAGRVSGPFVTGKP
jgi:hypothetical protein